MSSNILKKVNQAQSQGRVNNQPSTQLALITPIYLMFNSDPEKGNRSERCALAQSVFSSLHPTPHTQPTFQLLSSPRQCLT